jgi:para-aminobenzoate synthetase component 1
VSTDSLQLNLDYLPYQQDSTELFSRLRYLPGAIFLDSAAGLSKQGRYDIISAEPCQLLEKQRAHFSDPQPSFFQHVQQALNQQQFVTTNREQLPFIGGAIGYWSYDMGRELEALPNQSRDELTVPDAVVGIYPWAIVIDHQKEQTVLVSQPQVDGSRRARIKSLLEKDRPAQASFELSTAFKSNLSRADYALAFAKCQDYIASGDCYQVNLAQRFHAPYNGDSWQAYLTLRQAAAAPYSAFFAIEDSCILCVSPEQFIQLRDQQVSTKPIKGTLPRGKTLRADEALARQLQNSAKDQAENLMIVDLLRNDLGKRCEPGSIRVDKLFELQSFATVHHLVSSISGRLADGLQATDLLEASFPGGSITGAPKVRAMEIIEELEPHRRSVYCGSIGYISADGQMDSNIAIRTLVADQGQLYCWAGGGIVADSNCEGEYQESLSKVSKLLQALGDDQFTG